MAGGGDQKHTKWFLVPLGSVSTVCTELEVPHPPPNRNRNWKYYFWASFNNMLYCPEGKPVLRLTGRRVAFWRYSLSSPMLPSYRGVSVHRLKKFTSSSSALQSHFIVNLISVARGFGFPWMQWHVSLFSKGTPALHPVRLVAGESDPIWQR